MPFVFWIASDCCSVDRMQRGNGASSVVPITFSAPQIGMEQKEKKEKKRKEWEERKKEKWTETNSLSLFRAVFELRDFLRQ